jgi:histidinol-phosphate/aromatic aminotransferase/cobyric acid decarboxylase-like protein
MLDLSVSLNPFAPDLRKLVTRHVEAGALSRYPDEDVAQRELAAAMGVDPRCLVLTNGGAEAIALVAACLGRGWVEDPDFSLYRRQLTALGPQGLDPEGPLFRSNPGNPLGTLAAPGEQAGVWDEAFYPLATGPWTRGDPVVVGSLTKLYACPGLRMGYVLTTDEDLAEAVARRRPAWSLNALATNVLPELLAVTDLPGWCERIRHARTALRALLSEHGFTVRPSSAPWVLVEDDPAGPGLRSMLAPVGVVVRDCASFGLPGTVRIAVPGERDLDRLAIAIRESGASR